jgi:hypothetical protein
MDSGTEHSTTMFRFNSQYLRIINYRGASPISLHEFALAMMNAVHVPEKVPDFEKHTLAMQVAYNNMERARGTRDEEAIRRTCEAYKVAKAPIDEITRVQQIRRGQVEEAMDQAYVLFNAAKLGDLSAIESAVLMPDTNDTRVGLLLGAIISQSAAAVRVALDRVKSSPESIGDVRVITLASLHGSEILAVVLAAARVVDVGDVVRAVVRWASTLDAVRAVFSTLSVGAAVVDECDSYPESGRNAICLAASREALGGEVLHFLRRIGATRVAGSQRYSPAHCAAYICRCCRFTCRWIGGRCYPMQQGCAARRRGFR